MGGKTMAVGGAGVEVDGVVVSAVDGGLVVGGSTTVDFSTITGGMDAATTGVSTVRGEEATKALSGSVDRTTSGSDGSEAVEAAAESAGGLRELPRWNLAWYLILLWWLLR